MKRREFVLLPLAALSAPVLSSLLRSRTPPRVDGPQVRVPLKFFTSSEAANVAAACERIFPRDDTGAGATDAGVVVYIDRQLAGPYGRDKYRYTKGPFVDSVREHGYQGRATPREIYRDGVRRLGDFARLSAAEQDAALEAIETTTFFRLLRAHTIEGMFCDPMHGGNAKLFGWKLIGYPGPRLSYRDEVEKHYGAQFRPSPASLGQVMGMAPRPWEEERD